ncbi:hypothetical protein CPU12_03085 [Malaciobacter molluscorum LMG 25693]|uniref:Tetratricopeptide repeat protein n=1 Tax=Malaciobacter molluscorum LMG 25693 TaxID=870501 RepID=A0A2G1DK27_9BACT|nr:hypothetical protein [Malaciobacter molluscorum]AXX91393.1 tetratricopeptide repeat protein [Malaciobacter molluscorum LMG 25693]PHO18858.1 hypothetical protein CPU12_03085 [Malaciobacter molluscorum LMG 25693]
MIKKLFLTLAITLSCSLYAKQHMSKSTYNSLTNAQKLMEENKLNKAKTILDELLKQDKNAYEKSYILQTLSNIYITNNKYEKVAKIYEQIIKLNAFEPKSIDSIKYSLAKIYLSIEKYKKSLKISESLLNSKFIKKEDIYENLILGYYYNKKYKKAIDYSNRYMSIKKQIEESWYKILYSSYIEIKDYNGALSTMEKMVKIFNTNEQYWVQLASLYQQKDRLKKSLSTLELAYKNNILTKKDNILYFINILLQNDVYNKAGILLTKAINQKLIEEDKKTFEILLTCYINAKEIDLAIKKLESSQFANENKYKMILANLYYNKEQYNKSIKIVDSMKTKTNSKVDGEKQILKALCYYELNNKTQSIKTLEKVVNNPYHKKRARSILKELRS